MSPGDVRRPGHRVGRPTIGRLADVARRGRPVRRHRTAWMRLVALTALVSSSCSGRGSSRLRVVAALLASTVVVALLKP